MTMEWDTRKEPRTPITAQVRVQINPDMGETVHLARRQTLQAKVIHLSTDGIGLLSPIFLPPGALVDIEVSRAALAIPKKVPMEGSMRLTGRIVYAKPLGDECQLGISFTKIENADRQAIQDFVSANERREEPRTPLD